MSFYGLGRVIYYHGHTYVSLCVIVSGSQCPYVCFNCSRTRFSSIAVVVDLCAFVQQMHTAPQPML